MQVDVPGSPYCDPCFLEAGPEADACIVGAWLT